MTYGVLASWLREGAEIRTTQLTEEFDFESYLSKYGQRAIPLFAVNKKDRLQFFLVGEDLKPDAGWTIVSIVRPDKDTLPGNSVSDKRKSPAENT